MKTSNKTNEELISNISLGLSGQFTEDTLTDILLKNHILSETKTKRKPKTEANTSIVFNKKENVYKKEHGYSVKIYETEKQKLLDLWLEMRKELGINCLWVEGGGFSGCITQFFKNYSQENKIQCSEYDL